MQYLSQSAFVFAGSKSSGGGGGDWLGLGGDDDGGLDQSTALPKTSTPFSKDGKKATPGAQGLYSCAECFYLCHFVLP